MAKEKETKECCNKGSKTVIENRGGGDAVYALGLFGSLFYYLANANSFQTVVMGILKSLVWPAMLIYNLFKFLNM